MQLNDYSFRKLLADSERERLVTWTLNMNRTFSGLSESLERASQSVADFQQVADRQLAHAFTPTRDILYGSIYTNTVSETTFQAREGISGLQLGGIVGPHENRDPRFIRGRFGLSNTDTSNKWAETLCFWPTHAAIDNIAWFPLEPADFNVMVNLLQLDELLLTMHLNEWFEVCNVTKQLDVLRNAIPWYACGNADELRLIAQLKAAEMQISLPDLTIEYAHYDRNGILQPPMLWDYPTSYRPQEKRPFVGRTIMEHDFGQFILQLATSMFPIQTNVEISQTNPHKPHVIISGRSCSVFALRAQAKFPLSTALSGGKLTARERMRWKGEAKSAFAELQSRRDAQLALQPRPHVNPRLELIKFRDFVDYRTRRQVDSILPSLNEQEQRVLQAQQELSRLLTQTQARLTAALLQIPAAKAAPQDNKQQLIVPTNTSIAQLLDLHLQPRATIATRRTRR